MKKFGANGKEARFHIECFDDKWFDGCPTDDEVTWFEDSPDTSPDCICSKCGEPIEHGVPFRLFKKT